VETFKSGAANHRLAIWDPARNGVRFLKELIFNLCGQLSEREWRLLQAIGNRHVGAPYAITYNGELVCLDYLQAVFEIGFMERHAPLAGAKILEVGAGYGRTCHAMLCNHDVAEYCIIDLGNALALARRYLATVLPPEFFARIRFLPIEEYESLQAERFDLCLNIDSFAEMEAETVRLYLAYIDGHCSNFFTKNPVGKYQDNSLESHCDSEAKRLAMQSGILRDVLDIYNTAEVYAQSRKFIEAYAPGPRWTCVGEGGGRPWSFYWQACYKRDGDRP